MINYRCILCRRFRFDQYNSLYHEYLVRIIMRLGIIDALKLNIVITLSMYTFWGAFGIGNQFQTYK